MMYETSLADLLCHVFIICGRKENVVNVAAINPKIVVKSMIMQPSNALLDIPADFTIVKSDGDFT
uniref:hypothetical protein n=1 Tax=Hassallia byssoidea TaxID=482630 RepID=UPI000591DE96